ncbi:hypothetical protein [Ottowia thiooxydans]|uniref:hypothetical protein n=1 Tax=Ottowia thiooxydans TaxID=219182 RepID=UPI0003FDCF9C|nr:hypothetical protein [Ottowia thiooxydans]
MKLAFDSRSTFIAGVLALLFFLAASALSATRIGIAGVCLISFVLGWLMNPSFAVYLGGIFAAFGVASGIGLLFGESVSSAMVIVPIFAGLLLLYAGVAFFVGRFTAMFWYRTSKKD